jgi:hypothetical protein
VPITPGRATLQSVSFIRHFHLLFSFGFPYHKSPCALFFLSIIPCACKFMIETEALLETAQIF